jgi:acyl-CoA:acyl-CoA alkyltransferase
MVIQAEQKRAGMQRKARISGIGACVGDTPIDSATVEDRVRRINQGLSFPAGLIEMATGVKERRYAAEGTVSSDLAATAATEALKTSSTDPLSIDLLVFAAASHDVAEPASANVLQQKTGCLNAQCIDVKNACNSFLNGLDLAASFIETGRAERAVVAAGEMLSPFVEWNIPECKQHLLLPGLTLGDAGAAFTVETAAGRERLYHGTFLSDGSHWELSTILGGGTLMGRDPSLLYFQCDGAALHSIAVSVLPDIIMQGLRSVGWTMSDVDVVVPHQVSASVIAQLCSKIGFAREQCIVTLDRFGNTAASSIPLAFYTAASEGRIKHGDRVLLVGGAAGFSAGVVPVIW